MRRGREAPPPRRPRQPGSARLPCRGQLGEPLQGGGGDPQIPPRRRAGALLRYPTRAGPWPQRSLADRPSGDERIQSRPPPQGAGRGRALSGQGDLLLLHPAWRAAHVHRGCDALFRGLDARPQVPPIALLQSRQAEAQESASIPRRLHGSRRPVPGLVRGRALRAVVPGHVVAADPRSPRSRPGGRAASRATGSRRARMPRPFGPLRRDS